MIKYIHSFNINFLVSFSKIIERYRRSSGYALICAGAVLGCGIMPARSMPGSTSEYRQKIAWLGDVMNNFIDVTRALQQLLSATYANPSMSAQNRVARWNEEIEALIHCLYNIHGGDFEDVEIQNAREQTKNLGYVLLDFISKQHAITATVRPNDENQPVQVFRFSLSLRTIFNWPSSSLQERHCQLIIHQGYEHARALEQAALCCKTKCFCRLSLGCEESKVMH